MNPVHFSTTDLKFLEKNFVLYDPTLKKCYSDFSSLEHVRVVLIGETHFSDVMHSLQERLLAVLFKIWNPNEKYSLLLEGLKPDEVCDKARFSFLGKLPENLTIRGSDACINDDATSFEKFITINETYSKEISKLEELVKNSTRKAATSFNQILENDLEISFVDGRVVVSKEAFVKLEVVINTLEQAIEPHTEFCTTSHSSEEGSTEMLACGFLKRNATLADCIIKTSSVSDRILAIWGVSHFLGDPTITKKLHDHGLSAITIIPKKKHDKKALRHADWRHLTPAMTSFSIQNALDVVTFSFPLEFIDFFHPRLRNFCKPTLKEIQQVFNRKSMIKQYAQKSTIEIPAGREIHLKKLTFADAIYIDDSARLSRLEKRDSLNRVISDYLSLGGFSNAKIHCNRLVFENIWGFKNMTLKLSSEEPMVIEAHRGPLYWSASELFEKMISLKFLKFKTSPDQLLGFHDLTFEEREHIMISPETRFIPWVQSKIPSTHRFTSKGSITIARGVFERSGINHDVLWLTSKEGFEFRLILNSTQAPSGSSSGR